MCCLSNKVIISGARSCLALGGLHEDKSCDTFQAMVPTNVKTVHQTPLLHRVRERPVQNLDLNHHAGTLISAKARSKNKQVYLASLRP